MRIIDIDPKLFKKNRLDFATKMSKNSVAIFHSNDLMPKNADQFLPFKQNSDLFYLTGINQEETVLVIIKEEINIHEFLFIRETNDKIKIWEGEKLTKKAANTKSEIEVILWNSKFKTMCKEFMSKVNTVYLNSNDHPRANIVVESRDKRFEKWLKNLFPKKKYKKCSAILYELRAVKNPIEIQLMQEACDITKAGVERVLKVLKPGVYEYEIEAEIIHEFLKKKSTGFAYNPIIASGENACILHYDTNNKRCENGEVVLMDFGAEYGNYASDLTRCFPVNGRFSERQKKVYNSVLNVLKRATKLLKPGVFLSEYEEWVAEMMKKELVDLQLLSIQDLKRPQKTPLYKKYYMHGTSHHLGLDVHDVSSQKKPLEEGMVLTCEPGIYIPKEGLGIRLENDILIQKDSNVNLMEKIPIEVEEIETLLNI